MVGVPDEIFVISFYNSTEVFCVWLKVPNYDLSTELTFKPAMSLSRYSPFKTLYRQ